MRSWPCKVVAGVTTRNQDAPATSPPTDRAVEVSLQLEEKETPEVLYDGTVARFLPGICAEGLNKGNRHHVRLSIDMATARKVGARRGKQVILGVEAGRMYRDGFTFFLSANGVWLTDSVPVACVSQT